MNRITNRPVVVGLDHSPDAWAALEHAAALAGRRRARLVLVHAYDPSQLVLRPSLGWSSDLTGVLHDSGERLLAEACERLNLCHPWLDLRTRLEAGRAAKVLIDESRTANTVVLGTRGSGGFAELLVGSTALHVASHAVSPVIVVPPRPSSARVARRGVVVGIDGSPGSESAIAYAFESAADLGERLTAVHVWPIDTTAVQKAEPTTSKPAEAAQDQRVALVESLTEWQEKFPDVPVSRRVLLGHPVTALGRASRQAKLLVVGSLGVSSVNPSSLGSVSHGVLHHAGAPVAVVHPDAPDMAGPP